MLAFCLKSKVSAIWILPTMIEILPTMIVISRILPTVRIISPQDELNHVAIAFPRVIGIAKYNPQFNSPIAKYNPH